VIVAVPSAAIAEAGRAAVTDVELTYVVPRAVPLKSMAVDAIKPVPATVSVCEGAPATTLAGVTDKTLGAGFAVGAGGVGWEGEGAEPEPPHPETIRKKPRDETTSSLRKIMQCKPSKRRSFAQERAAVQLTLPQTLSALWLAIS
jgi:hypothetical protein